MKDIIGFGAINIDLFFQVNNFTKLNKKVIEYGFVPFIYGGEDKGEAQDLSPLLKLLKQEAEFAGYSGGGSAANVGVAGAKLGLKTGIVGKIGSQTLNQFPDFSSTFLLDSLQDLDQKGLIINDGLIGFCLCLIDASGERSLRVFPNINDTLSYEEIELSYIKDCRFLHLTSFVGEQPFQAQIKVAQELAKEIKISLDPGNIYARKGLASLKPLIKHCYIIFATRDEIELLTGGRSDQGFKSLLELGVEIFVLKLGKDGSLIYKDDKIIPVKAQSAEALDSTGAGDVYTAAFLSGLIEKKALSECGKLASKASALSLSAFGRKNYPTKDEILSY